MKGKFKKTLKRITSASLAVTLVLGSITALDAYYQMDRVSAAALIGESNGTSGDQTIKGAQNMGNLDNSGATTYWYAGNGFYGMNRSAGGFGESYDPEDWLLVDTDAMWGGKYLYSQFGDNGTQNGYTYNAESTPNYYQKILTYGEGLWAQNKNAWFTGKEQSGVGTATVTTSDNTYRSYEKVGNYAGYNYETASTTADNIANYVGGKSNNIAVTGAKLWYDTDRSENVNGGYRAASNKTSTTNQTSNVGYLDNSNSLNDQNLGVGSSNVYSIQDAHMYAPSYNEFEENHAVAAKINDNMNGYQSAKAFSKTVGDYIGISSSTKYPSPFAEGNNANWLTGGGARTHLWSRSFSGLRVNSSSLGAWFVNYYGSLDSNGDVASACAVAPAFNLDSSAVVMARSAQATTSPSASLARYNPNELGTDVNFTLESDALSINTGLDAKKLTNVVAGQTYDISYDNASTTGEAHNASASATLYVSAAIYNENNEMIYYGQLGQVSEDGSGKVSLTIPEDLESGVNYKLAIFEEQINGSYNQGTPSGKQIQTYTTDYVSPMNVATFTLDGLSASVNEGATLTEETEYSLDDIAALITVNSASKGTLTYGTDYKFASFDGDASLDGAKITMGDNGSVKSKTITFTIEYVDGTDQTVVPSTTVELTVVSKGEVTNKTYQKDQESKADAEGFYSCKENGITWKYKTDDNGNIVALYTADTKLDGIMTDNQILVLPKQVNGLTVVAVGGGTKEHPVVATTSSSFVQISLPDTVTTINDYAFAKMNQQNLELMIPSTVKEIGAKAFYKSSLKSVKINGMAGKIGYLAFGKLSDVQSIVIKGNGLTIGEEAFNGSDESSLLISGNVAIDKNAFKDNKGITSLYLPETVTLKAYAFNGCSSLESLEANVSALPNKAFDGCNAINKVILDDNVQNVAYNWNGQNSNVDRTVVVKNENTIFEFYNKGEKDGDDNWTPTSEYKSAFGTAGKVVVYYDGGENNGSDLVASYDEEGNGILVSNLRTLDLNNNVYKNFAKGLASSVTYKFDISKTTEQLMETDSVTNVNVVPEAQTGIDVTVNGSLLNGEAIDKAKLNVVALFDTTEGNAYDAEHFYVVRASQYAELSRNNNLTEEAIAALEPLTVEEADIKKGLDAAVITFYALGADGSYAKVDTPFATTVSIRAEQYTDQSYVEKTYGSYENVVSEIHGLNEKVTSLEGTMRGAIETVNNTLGTTFDVNASDLSKEYEKAISALTTALANANANNEASVESIQGFLSTVNTTFGSSIALPENASAEDINTALAAALDAINHDCEEKTALIGTLRSEYVTIAKSLSDYMENTEDLTAEDVDADTVVEIRKAVAKALAELQSTNGKLQSIGEAINGSSLNIKIEDTSDVDAVLDGVKKYIKEAEKVISDKNTLAGQLGEAQTQIESYSSALNSIYEILSSDELTVNDLNSAKSAIASLNSRIEKLNGKVEKLTDELASVKEQNEALLSDLESVNAKIKEAEEKQAELEAQINALQAEKESLANQITAKEQENEQLQSDYEKAIKEGNEEAAAKIQEQLDANKKTLDELNQSKEDLEKKETELASYKEQVASLQAQLTTIQNQLTSKDEEIARLKQQVEALSNQAENYQMTVENANELFGLSLKGTATKAEVEAAIRDYVNQKVASDTTIKKIQELVGSSNSGAALVSDVSEAISNGSTGLDDSVINKDSNNYKTGFADGVASVNVDNNDEAVASLTNQVKTLSNENKSLNSELDKVKKNNSELAATNNTLNESIKTLSAENKSLANKITALTNENSSLKADLEAAKKTASSAGTSSIRQTSPSATANTSNTASTSSSATSSSDSNKAKSSFSSSDDSKNENSKNKTVIASSAFKSSSNGKVEAGTPVAISMPDVTTANTVADKQKATTKLIKLSSSDTNSVTSEGSEVKNTTDAQKNSAYTVLNYYLNHLDELVDLGATKLEKVAVDDTAKVTFDVVSSIDVAANDEQKAAMDKGENVSLNLKSEQFKNGDTYLIVHESEKRGDTFDVEVVTAKDGAIDVTLPDLSPITIAHVTTETVVGDSEAEVLATDAISDEETKDKSPMRNIAVILMIVAIGGAAALAAIGQKKKKKIAEEE